MLGRRRKMLRRAEERASAHAGEFNRLWYSPTAYRPSPRQPVGADPISAPDILHGLADIVRPLGLTAGDTGELVLALMAAVDRHRGIDAGIDEVFRSVQMGELTSVTGEPMVNYVDMKAVRSALIQMVGIVRAEALAERQVKLGEAAIESGRMVPTMPSMSVLAGQVWVAAMPGVLRVFNAVEEVQFETTMFETYIDPHPVFGVPESSNEVALVPKAGPLIGPILVLTGLDDRGGLLDQLSRWGCDQAE